MFSLLIRLVKDVGKIKDLCLFITFKNFSVLLNRLLVAYQAEEKIEVVHSSKIKDLLTENKINPNTIVYNTAIANEQDYNNWEEPIKTSWLKKYI